MHPDKFMKRSALLAKPQMSEAERAERMAGLSAVLVGKRKDAIDARRESGIELIWLACEEAYLGIDDANRHEFAAAQWAKPSSMSGPLTTNRVATDDSRSTAYVRLTSRYVDNASAKLGEILLPIDDKAFSFEATPDPDLVKELNNRSQLMHPQTGAPLVQPVQAGAPGHPSPAAPAPLTAADVAQKWVDEANDKAKAAEKRVYDWMTESQYPAEARKVIHDAARVGVGVLKGPFPEAKESRAITKTDGGIALQLLKKIAPAQKWIDVWNFFPCRSCGENIHDGDSTFERDFMSRKKLLALKKQDGYLKDKIDQVVEEGPGKCNTDSANPADKKNNAKRFEIWYYYGTLKREEMALAGAVGIEDLPEDQEDVNAIVTMVNDSPIRAVINPLDSGAFPYRVMSWSRRAGHWAGVGVAEQISMPQRMVVAATRALLNNAGLSAGPQIIIDQLGVIPADGSWKLTPNKIWYKTAESGTADVRDAFLAVLIPSVQKEMMAVIEYGMKLAEESSGIPLVTQGQTGPTTPQTFGQAELQNNNSLTWLRSIGYRFDDMITEPLVQDYYEYLLLDPGVPNKEKGDFQINAHGSIAMVERAIQEQTLIGLTGAAGNPAFKVDPAKLFAEILKSKRIDPRTIQYSEEKQKQMDAQPPEPPLPIAVEQLKGQNALNLQQAKSQAELQQDQLDMQHEQQMLQAGGITPHMAQATARIEQERIKARSQQIIQASRSNAELARAEKEQQIAQQNGQYRLAEMQLQKDIALLEYANREKINLDTVKSQLAKSAMDNQTKKELAAAEIALAQSEGNQDRAIDLHKHHNPTPSLVRDEVSTDVTP